MIKRLLAALRGTPPGGGWSVATGDEDGAVVIVRMRQGPRQGMRDEDYPGFVHVLWSFDGAERRGMPSAELSERMTSCEELLQSLEGPGSGLLATIITGNNRREWVWSVADTGSFVTRAQTLLAESEALFPVVVVAPPPG